ncbi:MAG TPA: hypothetical protein VHC22_17855 [Pirellulales bacterium]|nr:hypothetical protein [Pirellulales bacterium]
MIELTDYLSTVSGPMEGSQIDNMLSACWDKLDGANEGGMQGHKLIGRMENVEWQPPFLSFTIERHGGTVLGSTRADLQHWQIDIERKTASLVRSGRRQLRPMAARTDIKAVATEIVRNVLAKIDDERVKVLPDGNVKVMGAVVFPAGSGYKQTIQGRRKKLAEYVKRGLAAARTEG